jgi:hypothetical protein
LALTGQAISNHGIIAIVSQSYLRAWRDGWQADLEALPGRVQRASLRPCECGLVMTKMRFSHLHCIKEHLQKWYSHIPRPKAISIPFLLQKIPNKHSFLAAEFTEPLEKMDL